MPIYYEKYWPHINRGHGHLILMFSLPFPV
uniref:Uncharacterized protein n=1 Tax=Arundo donax TaxID=35708 RepID=A0A0A9BGV9_ARUDO